MRLILQVAGTFVFIGLLLRLHSYLDEDYYEMFSWSNPDALPEANLRIIVFGTQDMVGSAVDSKGGRDTWPQLLCHELNCSSLLSFVPDDQSSPGVTSNAIYGAELEALHEATEGANLVEHPASDFNFVAEQYPVPSSTADLSQQLDKFLSLPPSEKVPRETLWIFTFGTWDVWKLAALSPDIGKQILDDLINHMFNHIEELYLASLDPESIAYSDFWTNVSLKEVKKLTAPNAVEKVDNRKLEGFRLLIPQLFDITLTPGWSTRPEPTIPHTKGEHLRNAAILTNHWNSQIASALQTWTDLGNAKPLSLGEDEAGTKNPEMEEVMGATKEEVAVDAITARSSVANGRGRAKGGEDIIVAPYPLRLAYQTRQGSGIRDAVTEQHMQRAGESDSQGRGTMSPNATMQFRDVWTPCVLEGSESEVVEEGGEGLCDSPSDHLFYDGFTVGQKAMKQLVRRTARQVFKKLIFREEPKKGWFVS